MVLIACLSISESRRRGVTNCTPISVANRWQRPADLVTIPLPYSLKILSRQTAFPDFPPSTAADSAHPTHTYLFEVDSNRAKGKAVSRIAVLNAFKAVDEPATWYSLNAKGLGAG